MIAKSADLSWTNGTNVIIAQRNTTTLHAFSQLQEKLMTSEISLLPVGNINEVPSLLHQYHLAVIVSSPGSNFDTVSKPAPDIQLTILLNIPKLGPTKARKLLEVFGSVHKVAVARNAALEPVIGKVCATQVVNYFQKPCHS